MFSVDPLPNEMLKPLVLFPLELVVLVQSNKFSRFVQFGADQDCHCGAAGCRQKLGVKPSKPKVSSDAALKLVACQVAVSSPTLKAVLFGKDVCSKRLFDTIKNTKYVSNMLFLFTFFGYNIILSVAF